MFDKIIRFLGIKKEMSEDFGQRRVLIVDDNKMDLALIKKTVEKVGHEVITAENGKQGYQLAKEHAPDLILSDCRMPEMDGVAMCKLLKEDDNTKHIPIVFLTGVERPTTVVECFEMGVDNYICKPIKPRILTSQMISIFKQHLAT